MLDDRSTSALRPRHGAPLSCARIDVLSVCPTYAPTGMACLRRMTLTTLQTALLAYALTC